MPKVLITGCGRSGTRYAKDVFKVLGLDLGHEKAGRDGTVDWHLAGTKEGYDVIFHQVRHPLDVVRSCHTISETSWTFIKKKDKLIKEYHPIVVRCMNYWLRWNILAESTAVLTYRVEDVVDYLPRITSELGMDWNPNWLAQVSALPTNNHSRRKRKKYRNRYPDLEFEDLYEASPFLAYQVRRKAEEYCYKNFEK